MIKRELELPAACKDWIENCAVLQNVKGSRYSESESSASKRSGWQEAGVRAKCRAKHASEVCECASEVCSGAMGWYSGSE